MRNLENLNENQCFSVISKRVTLDLSHDDEDIIQQWIYFLKAYNDHYKQQFILLAKQKDRNEQHE